MSNDSTINFPRGDTATDNKTPMQERAMDVLNEHIVFQILHGLGRIEHKVARIERRLSTRAVREADVGRPKLRPMLTSLLLEGWLSEVEIIEKTGWQMEGLRSFMTKLRGIGYSVETDLREGVTYYRIGR